MILSFACLGSLVGLVAGWLVSAHSWRGPVVGGIIGAAVAVAVVAAQSAAFFAAMGSGQDPAVVWAVFATSWALMGATSMLAIRAWAEDGAALMRYAPAAVVAGLAAYAMLSNSGSSEYFALKHYHADSSWVYVHFSGGGTWYRTFNEEGSSSKVRRCRSFLAKYPHSAYRPAALVMLAESQFELWDFRAADRALRTLAGEYPNLRGYPEILRSISHYTAGRAEDVLSGGDESESLKRWLTTQGALLAGAAAERLGLPGPALGFYNDYVGYLRSQPSSSWSPGSIAYALRRGDSMLDLLNSADKRVPRATVHLRVLAGRAPLPSARVAVVRPHRNAAFPADSKQFTGAWSVAAWGGVCGITGRNGPVVLKDVPYGSYDLVIGLDLKVARKRCVIAPPACPLTIDRPTVRLAPIQLVPAVELVWPRPGAQVSLPPRLIWRKYPKGAYYSVSIVVVNEPAPAKKRRAGKTCWSRSHVAAESTTIDAQHFLDGQRSLRKGGSYMWIVYAYGSDGRLLSSSEHYSQLHEPIFTLK